MFKKKVIVSNLSDASKYFSADFWIDTGAIYSFIPEDFLEKIEFQPEETRTLIFADGRTDKRLFGFCKFQIENLSGNLICPVIAGAKDSLFLLGATALENFGVEVDPVNKELKPILAVIGGFVGSR